MKKHYVIIATIALLLSIGLSGCTEENNTIHPEKNMFVGTWKNTTKNITRTIILFSNDSCSLSILNETGTWDIEDGKLVLKFPDSYLTYIFNYEFSNNERTLSLSSALGTSMTQVFTKQ